MQETLTGQFRSATPAGGVLVPLNLRDVANTGTLGWTQGGTILDQLTVAPQIGQVWKIIGWTISINGLINDFAANFGPAYGRLGKVIGGVIFRGTQTLTGGGFTHPWVNPMIPLPADIQNLATIWDGDTDAPFPKSVNGSAQTVDPRVGSNQLPIETNLSAGENLLVGLWLTPSLVQSTQIAIYGAQYVITYERSRR